VPLSSHPDHVAIAVPDIDAALPRWRDTLGGRVQWRFHTPTVFRGCAVQFRNAAFLEILMPSEAEERTRQAGGPSGFVTSFLDRFGASVHHVTLKVPDFDDALATLTAAGFDLVDVNGDDPHWQEVFLRPSQVGGLVVQVACSDRSNEDWARANGTEVPAPPPDGATLLGPQLVHDDLDEARRVWTALGGTVTADDDGLLVAWDDEPLTIAVRAGDERRAVGLRCAGTSPRPADPDLGPPVLAIP
jgi:catechol 2,3-dioxygenase-like lactoylglutathione lyase family enzyme